MFQHARSEVTMLERTRVARLQRDAEEMAKEIRDLKDMFQVCAFCLVPLSKEYQCTKVLFWAVSLGRSEENQVGH